MAEQVANVLFEEEAEEVSCSGLAKGFAHHLYTQEKLYAAKCEKNDGPFMCSECGSDAVLRKCTETRDHFAHKARLSPVIGSGEGEMHSECKRELVGLLQQRFSDGKWEKERPIPENKYWNIPKLRPDASGRIQDVRVPIEVQASTLTIEEIVRRTNDYTKRKIALLWLVPLREPRHRGRLPS